MCGCRNSNKNYLHVVPSAQTNRVIKRTEDKEYLVKSTSVTLHDINSYYGQEMKEIVFICVINIYSLAYTINELI